MFILSPAKRAERERRDTAALVDYVGDGTALLAGGDTLSAYRHFTDPSNWEGAVPVEAQTGPGQRVMELMSRSDLLRTTTFLAGNSSVATHMGGMGAVVTAWCHVGARRLVEARESRDPAVSPGLVEELQHEATLVAAEEWVHLVQQRRGRPIAGIRAGEADVAAHFHGLGIELSADFLTRYPERAAWAAETHPERADEIAEFGRTHHLRFAPGPREGHLI